MTRQHQIEKGVDVIIFVAVPLVCGSMRFPTALSINTVSGASSKTAK